jgi:hypothetical protein
MTNRVVILSLLTVILSAAKNLSRLLDSSLSTDVNRFNGAHP